MNDLGSQRKRQALLAIGALGVVYGDIGTSPLYALRECFFGHSALAVTRGNVLGILSLVFWSLLIVVTVKYLLVVMRLSNRGEGGIMALLALAFPERGTATGRRALLLGVGLFGAALLYGDGMLTPAVTVLSAIEGLNVATTVFEPYVVPLSVVVLVALFSIQRIGTGRVGGAFGPVMVLWFLCLGALGLRGILLAPEVMAAINPWYAVQFFVQHGWTGFVVLGAVFLVVTGAEALYADMGHFGAGPIRLAWFGLVLPSLYLNYLGQGALLLSNPGAAQNPFYNLAPDWARFPLVLLATAAAVIASQALISGTFSLTMQAVQLGYLPRMAINHTSHEHRGQIYVPVANWGLMVGCVLLVAGFGSSSRLAAAYGIAVTLTMVVTTILFYLAARRLWGWSALGAGAVVACFLVVDVAFTGANLLKIAHGGWVPLLIGGAVFTVMATWQSGRRLLRERLSASVFPLNLLLEDIQQNPPPRVPGTAVFMAGNPQGAPLALTHNLKHNKVLHERNVLLTVSIQDVAHVEAAERLNVEALGHGFHRVTGHYGFMDEPDVPALLDGCSAHGLAMTLNSTTFFLSSETILPTRKPGLARWRKLLFALLARNAQRATSFFRLPANRVVELGMQVEL
jgi:KUP system potassium uptake protein